MTVVIMIFNSQLNACGVMTYVVGATAIQWDACDSCHLCYHHLSYFSILIHSYDKIIYFYIFSVTYFTQYCSYHSNYMSV